MKRKHAQRLLSLSTLLLILAVGTVGCKSAFLWVGAWVHDKPGVTERPAGTADDASRLNRTRVAEVWAIPANPTEAETQLRRLLARASAQRLRVSIAGARHSMGGHTIYPDGIVLDMLPFNHMKLDPEQNLLHVGAGARWSSIVPYLDAHGQSVAVMQSNNDFSVGGSISVNCHGWQHNGGPIASTVESFRLMKADGTMVRCSREENAELFALALGGYGLFGVILDATIRVVPNERYRPEAELLPAEKFVARFTEKVEGQVDIGMVYGRLCIVPGEKTFLREAILTVMRKAPCPREEIPQMHPPTDVVLRREVYRAQIGSVSGKEARWSAEKKFGQQLSGGFVSRNQLLNESAAVFQEQNVDRTDILHEYFVPPGQVNQFLERARAIIPRHQCDLLNVTVRHVRKDRDTLLHYADRDMFAFVMLFNQPRTPEADQHMAELTRELIDASLECEGRYYLPYRLHACREQFQRAYPQAARFFERKRAYDPAGLFQNQFYREYTLP
jgi:FAD/FMN-containing dehydrogenase